MDDENWIQKFEKLEEDYQTLKKDLSQEEKWRLQKRLYRIDAPNDAQIYILSFFLSLGGISFLYLPYLYFRLRGFTYGLAQSQLIEIENIVETRAKLSFYQHQFFEGMYALDSLLQSFIFFAVLTFLLWIVLILFFKRFYHAP